MAHRFYVPPERISDGVVRFSAAQRSQMRNVLRMRPGDQVSVFDGGGSEYGVHVEALDPSAEGLITETSVAATESPVRLTLIQGMPKGDKLDLILQKCTEIGVVEFVLVVTERTIPRIARDKLASRLDRWQSIVIEACEQSGRAVVPRVSGVFPLGDALDRLDGTCPVLVAWEGERWNSLCSTVPSTDKVALVVGPEGGLSPSEVDLAARRGAVPVSLGPRILRAETAAIVGSALVINEMERCRTEAQSGAL